MKLLIIGGTRFLGRPLVETACARGHEVTLFNRGETNPDLYPDVAKLRGDRDGGLDVLRGRRWDAVIDTCGFVPRIVRESVELMADLVDYYIFISTIGVYVDWTEPGTDENAPLETLEDETVEEVTDATYGPLKVLCERSVEAAMPGRALVIRPGLIVGPHDLTDRFTYWPVRVAAGGEVLAPESHDYQVQFIDVRDLGAWIIGMIEAGKTGSYNATGPDYALTLGALLEACADVTGSGATITWVDKEFLAAQDVTPWRDLPLWIPGAMQAVDCSKAIADGLTFRPVAETIRDTLDWHAARPAARPADYEWPAGLARSREAELLKAWHAQGE